MPTAVIVIDQLTHTSAPIGVPGRSRQDLELGEQVRLRNADDTDVSVWRWSLLDRPAASSATLSTLNTPVTFFTPDVEGTYRISLSVNGAGPNESQIRLAAVLDAFGRRVPAANEIGPEANWLDGLGLPNAKGWQPAIASYLLSIQIPPPQLVGSLATESVIAGSPAEVFVIGGLALPAATADIEDYDWVDLTGGAAVGDPPLITGYAFPTIPGFGGLATLQLVQITADTGASVAGDRWALVLFLRGRGPVLATRVTMV